MPGASKKYSPAGSSPDTPSSPNLARNSGSVNVRKQGASIPNTGNLNVIIRMNSSTHHTTPNSGGGKKGRGY